jgi:asparagine synthase (glutamine-hydrolysing)
VCGFAGVLNFEGRPPDERALSEMRDLLRHRGPDDSGIWVSGGCGMAHTRLSVIDLSAAGRQPMANEDGTVVMVYNGEVYNFRELRERFALDGKGHRFRSRTDTEVLLHLYEELGEDFLQHLNGMFSLALWDNRRHRLLLARDPFGVKPLFLWRDEGRLLFSSEIKAFAADPSFDPRPSAEALYHYLSLDYIPGDLTAFEGVTEMRPGTAMVVGGDGSGERSWSFFELTEDLEEMTEEEACERSLEMVRRAVRRQLVSDVPVGVMLSGGMDSSTLVALMAEARGGGDFHTFSIGFEEPSFDESGYAAMVGKRFGTEHHRIMVKPREVADLLPGYLAYIDEPYADGSAIPTYLLSRLAREHVTVLLSGEGGDEVFAGYDTHAAYKVRRMYRCVPRVLRSLARKLIGTLPVSYRKLSFEFKAKRFVKGAELDVPSSHFYWRVVLDEQAKRDVLRRGVADGFSPTAALFQRRFSESPFSDQLNRLLHLDVSYHLPDDLMVKNDRMTMAHSLEARVPFTDLELVRFLFSVPVSRKMPFLRKKNLLRKAMRDILPGPVVKKKKVGLEMPYSSWFRDGLRELAGDTLSPDRIRDIDMLDPEGVQKLWNSHQCGQADHGRALWGIFNYVMWYDMYVRSSSFRSHLGSPPDRAQ